MMVKMLPIYNGVSKMDMQNWSYPDELLASDSCLKGCGAWLEGKYFHCEYPDFISSMKLHINGFGLLMIMFQSNFGEVSP